MCRYSDLDMLTMAQMLARAAELGSECEVPCTPITVGMDDT